MGEMLAIGVGKLHLSLDDFWSLTLAQFDAILMEYKDSQKRLDTMFGNVVATIRNIAANWGRSEREEPLIVRPNECLTYVYSTGKMSKGYKLPDGGYISEEEFQASQDRVKRMAGV